MTDEQRAEILTLLRGAIVRADRLTRAIERYSERSKTSPQIIAMRAIADLRRGHTLDGVMAWLVK